MKGLECKIVLEGVRIKEHTFVIKMRSNGKDRDLSQEGGL